MRRLSSVVLAAALLLPAPALAVPALAVPALAVPASPGSGGDVRIPEWMQPHLDELPLYDVTIALDPGHQLGNRHFPEEVNRLVPAGGFRKPCNTTGTSTDDGYAEATLNFRVARLAARRLRDLGASVELTRTTNSEDAWGPCVHVRGGFGSSVGARLMVSLHADGSAAASRGFHVIAPAARAPYTVEIAASSLQLAKALRGAFDAAGVPRSDYVGQGSALAVRDDLGTLNLSDVPVVMVELGNMRNPDDARLMRSAAGQERYADAVVEGIRRYLGE